MQMHRSYGASFKYVNALVRWDYVEQDQFQCLRDGLNSVCVSAAAAHQVRPETFT